MLRRSTSRSSHRHRQVTRFVRGNRRIGGVRFSSASARLSPTAPQSPTAMRFELGSCNPAATSRLRICPGCTTRSFEAGFTITDGSTARKLIDRCANWTERWRVGRHGNTRNCTVVLDARHGGSLRFLGAIRGCLRTGRWCGEVPLWEPYECTVLGESRGVIPRAYSPSVVGLVRWPYGTALCGQRNFRRPIGSAKCTLLLFQDLEPCAWFEAIS